MATNFPTSLDAHPSAATLAAHTLNTDPHSTLHGDLGLAVDALEAKVGIDSSAVTSTLDYIIKHGVNPSVQAIGDALTQGTVNTLARADHKHQMPIAADIYALAASINTQTASYTLVLADAGKIVEMNVAGANNLTVPTNASVAFPVGTIINLTQLGAGATTVVAAGGVTVSCRLTLVMKGQYATAQLYKRATDTWILSGDMT